MSWVFVGKMAVEWPQVFAAKDKNIVKEDVDRNRDLFWIEYCLFAS
jgi:hypothetical protein